MLNHACTLWKILNISFLLRNTPKRISLIIVVSIALHENKKEYDIKNLQFLPTMFILGGLIWDISAIN